MNENESNLVILGTARKNSYTEKALPKIVPNHNYTLIDLLDFKINHYVYEKKSNEQDDFNIIVEKMLKAETITFATPVYWYSMSGRMKVFFDRLTDLLGTEKGRSLAGKNVYLIATGGESELPEGFDVPFRRTAQYFKMSYQKTFYVISE